MFSDMLMRPVAGWRVRGVEYSYQPQGVRMLVRWTITVSMGDPELSRSTKISVVSPVRLMIYDNLQVEHRLLCVASKSKQQLATLRTEKLIRNEGRFQ